VHSGRVEEVERERGDEGGLVRRLECRFGIPFICLKIGTIALALRLYWFLAIHVVRKSSPKKSELG
jgi:hypothetical protein